MSEHFVLSGIRATGRLHLGNYLGAVKGMLSLAQNQNYTTLYTVVDLHTMTTPFEHLSLKESSREVFLDYLACGLDPKQSIIFIQSHLADLHAQLMFYFSTIVSVARMQHLPTYKDKIRQHPHNVTMALLNYPVLMAADILLYKANKVPVGIDQEPHLEIAREIARKMNLTFGTAFPEPTRFSTKGEYIPSLLGEGKMSKSVEGSYINLTDDIDTIHQKIRSVPTATQVGGEMSHGVKTLFTLLDLFAPSEKEAFLQQFTDGSLRFVELKDTLAQAIFSDLRPIQEHRAELETDNAYIDSVIEEGAQKAREIAQKTIDEVKEKIGI